MEFQEKPGAEVLKKQIKAIRTAAGGRYTRGDSDTMGGRDIRGGRDSAEIQDEGCSGATLWQLNESLSDKKPKNISIEKNKKNVGQKKQ